VKVVTVFASPPVLLLTAFLPVAVVLLFLLAVPFFG
jgi:hypothetical protein